MECRSKSPHMPCRERHELTSSQRFRWAVCQLETMKECLTPAMIRAELKQMPQTLDQTYDRILQAVPRLHQPYVQSALHWLAFAARPLLLSELAEAVVVNPYDEDFNPEDSRLVEESKVLELCGALVSVFTKPLVKDVGDWLSEKLRRETGVMYAYLPDTPKEFKVVSLSHQSVKEYIVSARLKKSSLASYGTSQVLASKFLASCCLNYLLAFSPDAVAPEVKFEDYPLLFYAARFWVHHWRLAQPCDETGDGPDSAPRRLLCRVLDPDNRIAIANWCNIWNYELSAEVRPQDLTVRQAAYALLMDPQLHLPPLYIAAYLGDLPIVESLVAGGCDVSEKAGYFGCPLAVAARFKHKDVVSCLLAAGADPNLSYDARYGTVLQSACVGGDAGVVMLLLEAGAKINIQCGFYNTAVQAAMSNGHMDVARLLISRGADLNLESAGGSTLHTAASKGDVAMVSLLLSAGHDVNHMGLANGTPLYGASLAGSLHVVQLLLRHGAQPNVGGRGEYGYPLCAAARGGHTNVCRALLRSGADPNVHGGRRDVTALEGAIESRDLETFRVVLHGGADPNVEARLYGNALHAAYWTGETDMARILLERGTAFDDNTFLVSIERYSTDPWFFRTMLDRGANIDANSSDVGSALMLAIYWEHEAVAWSILGKKPYLDALGRQETALFLAARRGMVDLAAELIRLGADVNKHVISTPLDAACEKGHFRLAKMLLESGADINLGRSLARAAEDDDEEACRFLVANGADIDKLSPYDECSPVQLAAKEGSWKVLRLLVEHGALLNGPAGKKGSVINYALKSKDESLVRFVIDHGAQVDGAGPGASALRQAILLRMPNLVPLLLEMGAPLDAVDEGETAMGRAWLRQDDDTMSLLIRHGASPSEIGPLAFIIGIEIMPVEELRKILDTGIDPNLHGDFSAPVTVRCSSPARSSG